MIVKMNSEQIKSILSNPESSDLELKESFHSEQEISKVICGFANTEGGLLFIGVDKKGALVGVSGDADELQQKLSACGQNVFPAPLMDIETHVIDGKRIVVVRVHRADAGNGHTFGGVIYVRLGSTTRKLEGQTMFEFLKNRHILCFDLISSRAKTEDIDEKKVQAYLSKRGQEDYLQMHSIKDFLISLDLAAGNGELKIKNAAALSFTKNPQFWFPQSEVKVVRFRGTEPIDVSEHQVLEGSPVELIEKAYTFIQKNISKEIKVKPASPQREEVYEYPLKVVREAVTNAIAHRDYFNINGIQISIFDDRIEITNPGSVPTGLTKELFGAISVQRNPQTYKILREMKYVEGLGLGVPGMINGMRGQGLVDPEFMWTDYFFRVTLRNKKAKAHTIQKTGDLKERQQRALEYLKKSKTIKTKQYAQMNKISEGMAQIDLRELMAFGYIKKIGKYRGAYYVVKKDEALR
jgi:ATP-dependent DNA helicase RecG